ncbi:GNAT family N-acetyltransferase [Rhizobium sp. PL01]|uniref:GNAT family N-acetyltransferase n=1 Tax=Rhizobium sp. PL01 TaxID=3085631 RepID=UPI0029824967|nr:GNAT family N-acetyltransferase [Rhizobium sp. PL01]MDW5313519.1 GNAT family N-acetyltransferase [Rhizobium sp. PL01]
MVEIRPLTPETDGFALLLQESVVEGHRMLHRLQENWTSGLNRFDRPGEILVGSFDNGRLTGICGRNIDPFANNAAAGRVRHLYVATAYRNTGVGGQLIRFIARDADRFFRFLNTRAPPQAYEFYEHLGFSPVLENSTVTHRLYF